MSLDVDDKDSLLDGIVIGQDSMGKGLMYGRTMQFFRVEIDGKADETGVHPKQ